MSELTPEARRMLMAARAAAEPTEGDRARVLGLVAGAIAATTASTAAASVASAKSTSLLGSALFLKVGAAVILSFGGGYALHAYTTAPSTTAPSTVAVASTPRVAPVQAPQIAAPIQVPKSIAPAPHAEIDAPHVEATPAASPTPRVRTAPMQRHSVTPTAHVAEEVASIGRAEAALERQDPRAALRALKEHAERFPQGELTQERWGLRAIALCSLHDATAGRESTRFLARHESSVLAQRVRLACEGQ